VTAGAITLRARPRSRELSARALRRLDLFFLLVVLVMTGHQAEHVAQVMQKNALANSCPVDCRGLLGFRADVEWVHVLYNHSILLALVALYLGFGLWRRQWREASPLAWWSLTLGIFAVQGYHAVEHAVKLDQWLARGHVSPQPGILGMRFSLIELHFVINTTVFVLVLVGYFGLGFHRRSLRRQVAVALPAALVFLMAAPTAVAIATRTPVQTLEAGVHRGPLVLDERVKLVGEPGAVVRGGIVVTAGGVQVKDVTVIGGETGILVRDAKNVLLERVTVRGATLDGIRGTRSSVTVRDCTVFSPPGAHGVELSFASAVGPNVVEGCTVEGGAEGVVGHLAMVSFRNNHVSGTSLHAISITEMSMGEAVGNTVVDATGVGIFCGDYSHCEIERNVVTGTAPNRDGGRSQAGYAIQAHFWAKATVGDNRLAGNARTVGAYLHARLAPS
jgi:Right handed beta helix region